MYSDMELLTLSGYALICIIGVIMLVKKIQILNKVAKTSQESKSIKEELMDNFNPLIQEDLNKIFKEDERIEVRN